MRWGVPSWRPLCNIPVLQKGKDKIFTWIYMEIMESLDSQSTSLALKMPTTKRSVKHSSQCSWHRLQGRGKISFESTSLKKTILQHFFVYNTNTDTYKHKHCAAQMCFLPDLSAQHDMIIAVLQMSFHTITDIVYTGRSKEKETSGLGGRCKEWCLSQAVLCKGNSRGYPVHQQTHDSWGTVSVCLHFHLSFHKLHRPSLAPGISFLQDVARCPLLGISRAIRDVIALRQE